VTESRDPKPTNDYYTNKYNEQVPNALLSMGRINLILNERRSFEVSRVKMVVLTGGVPRPARSPARFASMLYDASV
jgi:hypothetical protein